MTLIFKWIDEDDNMVTLNQSENAEDYTFIITNREGNHMRMQMSLVALAGLGMQIEQVINNSNG